MTNMCQWTQSQPICRPADYCNLSRERAPTMSHQFLTSYVLWSIGAVGLTKLAFEINDYVLEKASFARRNHMVRLATISCACLYYAQKYYYEAAKYNSSLQEDSDALRETILVIGAAFSIANIAETLILPIANRYFPLRR